MHSQRDLYQAYRLTIQRIGLALLRAQPNQPEWPLRRQNIGFLAGIMVAVLLCVGFAVYGLLRPGGTKSLENPGTLIIERETGARFVYSQDQRRLIPVANYASARLVLGEGQVKERVVAREALTKYERGAAIGIPDAPDSLPTPANLTKGPWSACVQERAEPTGRKPYVTLVAGREIGGTPVAEGDALLVDVGGQTWAVWRGTRMRVAAGIARGLTAATPAAVPVTWLNALPEGPDLAAPPIAGRGRPVAGPGGKAAAVGQVFRAGAVAGGEARWYVLLGDGLAPITQGQATLLLSDPDSRAAYGGGAVKEIAVDAATANAAPRSRTKPPADGLPAVMPRMTAYDPANPLCVVYAETGTGSTRVRLTTGARLPEPRGDATDLVRLPPGRAVLAGVLPGDGQLTAVQSYYLITPEGRRYAVPGTDVLAKLGYAAAQAAPVPANVLQLIPEGPVLDPARAAKPVLEAQ
ncbi:type VII secretion protein EccB [Nonomuraea solani]|uniref:Type VII secretion protein EccB n=1 Tax=Nonomuraea solani TaxID=1144553 RepID=A0A1H5UZP3_9ACTN|nr:type VII secretion protein EccB [Nonomuraea solani]SEF80632.1 type VII secretion protein EccB [Nonomuraea solani]